MLCGGQVQTIRILGGNLQFRRADTANARMPGGSLISSEFLANGRPWEGSLNTLDQTTLGGDTLATPES